MEINGKEVEVNRKDAVVRDFDKQYCELLKKILEEGELFENRTGVDTLSIPGGGYVFDVGNEFPILESKKVILRKALSELLWIYQAQTNDVSWLRERGNDIWDKWAVDSDGIYRVYEADTENYDADKEVNVRDVDGNIIIGMKAKSLIEGKNIKEAKFFGKEYAGTIARGYGYIIGEYKRFDYVRNSLANYPHDRRMVISLWQDADLRMAVLPPCVWSNEYKVYKGTLNCFVDQRSADVPDSAYDDGHVLKKTIQDLKRLKDSQKPFFLACGFWKPHLPFCAPKKYWDMYPSISIASNRFRPSDLPDEVQNSSEIYAYARVSSPTDEEFLRQVKTGYYACVSYIDHLFGVLMDTLDELNLSNNTIVVLLGDHGWDLGEHQFVGKHNLFNITTRVPLIVRVPGLKAGRSYSMVELVDIYPSLCELCGIREPENQLDGKSFVPILKNPRKKVKNNVYVQWQGGDDLLNSRFNFAWWEKSSHMMLFDHQIDPQENKNRSDDSQYFSIKDKLFKRLKNIKKYAFRKH